MSRRLDVAVHDRQINEQSKRLPCLCEQHPRGDLVQRARSLQQVHDSVLRPRHDEVERVLRERVVGDGKYDGRWRGYRQMTGHVGFPLGQPSVPVPPRRVFASKRNALDGERLALRALRFENLLLPAAPKSPVGEPGVGPSGPACQVLAALLLSGWLRFGTHGGRTHGVEVPEQTVTLSVRISPQLVDRDPVVADVAVPEALQRVEFGRSEESEVPQKPLHLVVPI